MSSDRIWADIAIPPGEFLAENLEAVGISQAELARRAGRPVQAINEMIQGRKEITPETAIELERVLGTPAHVWVRLEADYRFTKARLEDRLRLSDQAEIARAFPYKAMAKLGWVPDVPNITDRVEALLGFFGVSSLRSLETPSVAYRRSKTAKASDQALLAWLRRGDLVAASIETEAFDPEGLRKLIPRIRRMTTQSPDLFQVTLIHLLAERGVALAVVPHLIGAPANGAARWLGGKAVLQMSVRYKWQDVFWFTLFHELAHLLLHGRRDRFVDIEFGVTESKEKQADRFAADALLPAAQYRAFIGRIPRNRFSEAAVREFARRSEVAPGIVVGRLQHDGRLPRTHLNGLRRQFSLSGSTPA